MIAAFFLINGFVFLIGMAVALVIYPIYLIASAFYANWRDERNLKRAWKEHERLLAKFNRCVNAGIMPPDELRWQLTEARRRYTSAYLEYLPD